MQGARGNKAGEDRRKENRDGDGEDGSWVHGWGGYAWWGFRAAPCSSWVGYSTMQHTGRQCFAVKCGQTFVAGMPGPLRAGQWERQSKGAMSGRSCERAGGGSGARPGTHPWPLRAALGWAEGKSNNRRQGQR